MYYRRAFAIGVAAVSLLVTAALAANPTVFIPDWTFKGSNLTGWHVLGQASWSAQNGELIGKAKEGGGGWLVLDKSYQDIGVFASFRVTGGAKAGILLRAEKTPTGMKGVFMSLDEGDIAIYRITTDAEGKETSREKLRPGGGQIRIAPPERPGASGRAGGGGGNRRAEPAGLPIQQPPSGYRANDWNQIELILDANILRPFLNEGGHGAAGGVAEEAYGRYGPIALYVGGTGEVRFKDVSYKDLGVKTLPQEKISSHFRMQRIDDFYYAWSAAGGGLQSRWRDGSWPRVPIIIWVRITPSGARFIWRRPRILPPNTRTIAWATSPMTLRATDGLTF